MEVEKSEKSLANSRVYEELRKESFIDIEFILIEKNWPFMHYQYTFRKTDTFLIIEDKIKEIHGPINNLEIHSDSSMNAKVEYHFSETVESRLNQFNIITEPTGHKMIIYYRYDNGYEWPLLCS